MNVEISNWLASEQDFPAGVALYEQHGKSIVIKRLLAAGSTSYSREVLARELERMVQVAPLPLEPAPAVVVQVATVTDVLKALHQARRPLLSEREYLHARLELLADAERGEAALRILDIGDELQKSYDAEAYYEKYGTLPEVLPEAAPAPELATLTDMGEIRRHLALQRTQRSKLKDRPDRLDDYAQVLANIELLESKLSQ
ncbi:hypothetical protein GCM10027346_20820 [Hymenobacter seoulensis]